MGNEQSNRQMKALTFLYKSNNITQMPYDSMFNSTENHLFSAMLIEIFALERKKLSENHINDVVISTNQYLQACDIDYRIILQHGFIIIYFNYEYYNLRTLADSLKMILYNKFKQSCLLNMFLTTDCHSLEETDEQITCLMNNRHYAALNGYWQRFSILDLKACNESKLCISEGAQLYVYNLLNTGHIDKVIEYVNEKRELIQRFHHPDHRYSYSTIFSFFMEVYMAVKLYYAQKGYFDLFFSRDFSEIQTRYSGGIYRLLELVNLSLQSYSLTITPQIDSGNSLIDSVVKYVDDHLTTVTLAGAAAHFHISSAHLSRSFKAVMNQNFSDYVSEKKIAQAAAMLVSNPELSVAQVAERMNYSTSAYFLNKFKKVYDMTPSAYRHHAISERN